MPDNDVNEDSVQSVGDSLFALRISKRSRQAHLACFAGVCISDGDGFKAMRRVRKADVNVGISLSDALVTLDKIGHLVILLHRK